MSMTWHWIACVEAENLLPPLYLGTWMGVFVGYQATLFIARLDVLTLITILLNDAVARFVYIMV